MAMVLWMGSVRLAVITNYPGLWVTQWFNYRGIAPSSRFIFSWNAWMVLSSAIQWMLIALFLQGTIQSISKSRHKRRPGSKSPD
jgi:hypothetical protein